MMLQVPQAAAPGCCFNESARASLSSGARRALTSLCCLGSPPHPRTPSYPQPPHPPFLQPLLLSATVTSSHAPPFSRATSYYLLVTPWLLTPAHCLLLLLLPFDHCRPSRQHRAPRSLGKRLLLPPQRRKHTRADALAALKEESPWLVVVFVVVVVSPGSSRLVAAGCGSRRSARAVALSSSSSATTATSPPAASPSVPACKKAHSPTNTAFYASQPPAEFSAAEPSADSCRGNMLDKVSCDKSGSYRGADHCGRCRWWRAGHWGHEAWRSSPARRRVVARPSRRRTRDFVRHTQPDPTSTWHAPFLTRGVQR